MPKPIKSPYRWRLHPKSLHDTKFIKFVGTCFDKFLNTNTNEIAASVRWEAFKAYLRRQMISYTSSITDKVNLKLQLLKDKIRKLEKQTYEGSTNIEPHQQEVFLLRAQYDELSLSKAENSLIHLKQTFYEQWQIWQTNQETAIEQGHQ